MSGINNNRIKKGHDPYCWQPPNGNILSKIEYKNKTTTFTYIHIYL